MKSVLFYAHQFCSPKTERINNIISTTKQKKLTLINVTVNLLVYLIYIYNFFAFYIFSILTHVPFATTAIISLEKLK